MSTNTTKNQLLDSYNKKISDIDQNTKNQKLSQASNHWRLMKYLPEQNAVNGITGGMTETATIRANNAYAGRLRDIESNASAQKIAAEDQYNAELKNMYSENYNQAKSTIEGWNKSSVELDDYVKNLKEQGLVSDMQYQDLLNLYVTAKETVEEDEKNQSKYIGESRTVSGLKNDHKAGENFHVNLGGETYYVESGGEYLGNDKEEILYKAKNANIGDKEVFYYNNHVYLKDGENIYIVR